MSAAFKGAYDAAGMLLSVAINAANKRVSVDAVERGADGLPPSFGAVLVAKSLLLGACLLREGVLDVAAAIETVSDNLDEKLSGFCREIDASNRVTVETLRGIEDALRQPQPQPTRGRPCRRGT